MTNGQKEQQRPITYWIGEGGGWLLRHVVSGLAATGITPNMFTFLGLGVNSWAAVMFAMGRFRAAAAILFLAGFLDMADGHRKAHQLTVDEDGFEKSMLRGVQAAAVRIVMENDIALLDV